MKKKNGAKYAFVAIPTPDKKHLDIKLQNLLWEFLDTQRSCRSSARALKLATFLFYCAYVSRNAEYLGIKDFDNDFSIDEVAENLGNKYLASAFIEYYSLLGKGHLLLPVLSEAVFDANGLSSSIANYALALDASGLSLTEENGYETAKTIYKVLDTAYSAYSNTREWGEYASNRSVADLVIALADVKDKTVLDFACGFGGFLARAKTSGAIETFGQDINPDATLTAKILCFFADPSTRTFIQKENTLLPVNSLPAQSDRVVIAPPFGAPILPNEASFGKAIASYYAPLLENERAFPKQFEDFCVARALEALSDDGVAVLHVSTSFLFHQHRARRELRRALVEKGYIRAIIELPGGCVPGTTVKSVIIVLDKKADNDGVLLVDLDSNELADKGFVQKGRGKCDITEAGIKWLLEIVGNREEIPMVSVVAYPEDIEAANYNLCYSTYGDLVDYDSIMEELRTTSEIVSDICDTQAEIEELSKVILELLDEVHGAGGKK